MYTYVNFNLCLIIVCLSTFIKNSTFFKTVESYFSFKKYTINLASTLKNSNAILRSVTVDFDVVN